MNPASTLFRRTDSELINDNFTIGYSAADIDLPATRTQSIKQPITAIHLKWVDTPEVVTLPKRTFYTRFGKRMIDVVVASLVIVLILSWLIPVIGLLILLESKGPVFFKQARSGRRAKAFQCFKFRTMTHGNKTQEPFRQTARNDDRVTQVGKFLRRTNLDEMPQFINVLLGDMSLVGPRPHAVPHDALHWDSPAYRERYWVKPGITGLAQIRGARGATGATQRMDHRVKYDHLYIPNQTLFLDLKICLRTLNLMFKGDIHAW
ncbi:sugar transferase [Spirosoma gilvum]